MAVTKKTSAKKITGKFKSVPKAKLLTKKSLAKKPHSKKVQAMKSFKIYREKQPFLTTSITTQTVYWSILLIFVMLLQVWILNIQLDVIAVTDSLSVNTQSSVIHSSATKAK